MRPWCFAHPSSFGPCGRPSSPSLRIPKNCLVEGELHEVHAERLHLLVVVRTQHHGEDLVVFLREIDGLEGIWVDGCTVEIRIADGELDV